MKNKFNKKEFAKGFLIPVIIGGGILSYFNIKNSNLKPNQIKTGLEQRVNTDGNSIIPFQDEVRFEMELPHESYKEINYSELYEMIARHEGIEKRAYLDSRGILTIGAGFNLEKQGARKRIESLGLNYESVCDGRQTLSNEQVYSLMREDVETAINDAQYYLGDSWIGLNPKAQKILIDMAYNLGRKRLCEFKNLRQALISRDYVSASQEMKDSNWYKQTGNRGRELVYKMREINN